MITSYPGNFFQQIETSTVPNPKLATQVDPNELIITLTAAILTSDGVAPTKPFVLTIRNPEAPELVYVKSGQVSADGKTITLTNTNQRNINRAESSTEVIDFETGNGGDLLHPQFTEVRVSIDPLTWQAQNNVIRGTLPSGGANWRVGRKIDEDIRWIVANNDANEPYFGYDSASNQFIVSPDGVSSSIISGGVTPTGGDGITVTAGVVAVDTTDTTKFVKVSSGAGDENKAAILDASGNIADGFIPSTIARDSELSGISSADGTDLTDGGATTLHTHNPFDIVDFDFFQFYSPNELTNTSGTATDNGGNFTLATGTTLNAFMLSRLQLSALMPNWNVDSEFRFKFQLSGLINQDISVGGFDGVKINMSTVGSTTRHWGFAIEDGILLASNADGTTQTKTTIGAITLTDFNDYRAVYTAGVDIKFYVNGVLEATHTTNLPTGAVTNRNFMAGIQTSSTTSKSIIFTQNSSVKVAL